MKFQFMDADKGGNWMSFPFRLPFLFWSKKMLLAQRLKVQLANVRTELC